ncbi:lanthionine synthetase C family protein [Staphylococcus hominis]|uniref:ElxC n=1 Tax=Staphylococcus epidermidis TaxID=1282 RepID=I6ZQX1_STAEP|nr:ElxC [Staphylococcus epidermidis]
MENSIQKSLSYLSDIKLVNKNIEDNIGSDVIFKISLAYGYPGIALLFNEAYKLTKNIDYYEYCHNYLSETLNLIKHNPMYSTSLFTGVMGYLFTLASCSNDGENYRNISYQILDEYNAFFNVSLNEVNIALLNKDFSKDSFDIINGAAGTLLSLLHIYDIYGNLHYNLEKWIQSLTNLLEKLIIKSISNNYPEHENVLTDLGVSHGITGIINIVNAAFKRDFGSYTLHNTLLRAKNFLLSLIEKYESSYIIPNFRHFSKENLNHRDAWCYGTPGVAMVLYNLGINLKDKEIINTSKKLASETLKRNKSTRLLISPTLCHGYSGIAIINKYLGNFYVEDYYYNQIENSKNTNLRLMFRNIDYNGENFVYDDNLGLLEGSSGVLLTLLSKKGFNSTWYKLFCFA